MIRQGYVGGVGGVGGGIDAQIYVHTSSYIINFNITSSCLRWYVRATLGVGGVGLGINVHLHVHTSPTLTSYLAILDDTSGLRWGGWAGWGWVIHVHVFYNLQTRTRTPIAMHKGLSHKHLSPRASHKGFHASTDVFEVFPEGLQCTRISPGSLQDHCARASWQW